MNEDKIYRWASGQLTDDELTDMGICAICLALRASHSGASDPMPRAAVTQQVAYLRRRERDWRITDDPFDLAVLAMLRATLELVSNDT